MAESLVDWMAEMLAAVLAVLTVGVMVASTVVLLADRWVE